MTEQDRKFIKNIAKRSDDLLRRVEALEKKIIPFAVGLENGTMGEFAKTPEIPKDRPYVIPKEDLTVIFKDKDKALANMAKLRRDILTLCDMYEVQELEVKYRV